MAHVERDELRSLIRRFLLTVSDDPTFLPSIKEAIRSRHMPKVKPELDDIDYFILDVLCGYRYDVESQVIAQESDGEYTTHFMGFRLGKLAKKGYVTRIQIHRTSTRVWRLTDAGRRKAVTPYNVA